MTEATSNRVFDAPNLEQGPLPAYKVVEWNQPVEKTICEFDHKSKQIVYSKKVFDKGYMVFFPRGHSTFYDSLEALEAAGFGDVVPMIKMSQDAEVSPEHQPPSVRRRIVKPQDDE